MKLFFTPGACSLAPHIVLRELDLPFVLEHVDLKTKKTSSGADFFSINPKGYVPALQLDDGEILTEGPSITQFLADKYAPGKLAAASGSVERARLNAHLTFIGTELHKGFSPLFNPSITAEARATVTANQIRKFALIDQVLAKSGAYLTGQNFTIADAYFFVVQSWAPMLGVDITSMSHIMAFAIKVATRPTVLAALEAEKAKFE
ncbi:glutathione transferase GstA [Duganella sp. CY15W]|uniref:glutathione transferase GstA n=1 Tax=Duganella sp. CY15W TaxID=2692172 RepID=UPI00136A2BEE|nr:glutathione transferase GstA [Duganella sp. CY15W]MYM29307.1 glutathione transferase GstA [Duganella sp. CY15W]